MTRKTIVKECHMIIVYIASAIVILWAIYKVIWGFFDFRRFVADQARLVRYRWRCERCKKSEAFKVDPEIYEGSLLVKKEDFLQFQAEKDHAKKSPGCDGEIFPEDPEDKG